MVDFFGEKIYTDVEEQSFGLLKKEKEFSGR